MEKYLLTDSILSYMREKFPYDLYEEDYLLFEKSIEQNESIIVDETKRNLNYNLQDEINVNYFTSKFKSTLIPDNKIFKKLMEIINRNPNFNFLNRDVIFGVPTPIPFVIATAIEKNLPIVVDETDKDYLKYKRLCTDYDIEIYNKIRYLKSLRGVK
ncbi:MAG: hypothetical protein NC033_04045 [Clostridiales bacterium]|nr:hypothetical protein [Clostridiales bacterium]